MTRRLDVFALSASYLAERALARIGRLVLAAAVATTAGAATIIGFAAARDAYLNESAALLLALAAVWLTQGLVVLARTITPKDRRP